MSRKDYRALAAEMRRIRPDDPKAYNVWSQCLEAIADAMAADNCRFCRTTFYEAAGAKSCNP